MKNPMVSLFVLLVFVGSAAVAESPVVLRVHSMVNTIDNQVKSLRKSDKEINLEGPNGPNPVVATMGAEVASISFWKDRAGNPLKASVTFAREDGGAEALVYWKEHKPVFAFVKIKMGKSTEEHRCYFSNSKPSVFRVGTRSLSTSDSRCKALAKEAQLIYEAITPGD